MRQLLRDLGFALGIVLVMTVAVACALLWVEIVRAGS